MEGIRKTQGAVPGGFRCHSDTNVVIEPQRLQVIRFGVHQGYEVFAAFKYCFQGISSIGKQGGISVVNMIEQARKKKDAGRVEVLKANLKTVFKRFHGYPDRECQTERRILP